MTVHDDLKAVLDQLERLDAAVVGFNPYALTAKEADHWLHSEKERLGRLSKAMSDTLIPTPELG